MADSHWLVLMDTDHIQKYIFATNRLKEIRGASLLLDQLNLADCHALLVDYDGQEIFIGGGGVLAIFASKLQAHAYITAVQAVYRKQTHVASITGVAVPVLGKSGEQDALRRARVDLRLAKVARGVTQTVLGSPYFRLCQSCNRYPVVAADEGDELCLACSAKRKADKPQHIEGTEDDERMAFPSYSGYGKFARRVAELYGDQRWAGLDQVPTKLDRLEGPDTSYIGFIHADVNGLGSFLEQQTSLDAIRVLGRQVEQAAEGALVDAVREVSLEPRGRRWPFLIIILGGDDITLVVPARQAVPLANALCLAFERRIKAALGEAPTDKGEPAGKLALSAGVVIAKSKHPAYALAELAGDLTKSAKRLSHELKTDGYGSIPTLDFQVVHSPTANPVEDARKEEYRDEHSGQVYWYTARPLPCRPLGALPGVSTLLDTIGRLRRSDFPRNKLNEWADLIYTSEIEQILGWQTLRTRVTGEAYQALMAVIRDFGLSRECVFAQPAGPGQPYMTPLLDLIELYDFAQG